VSTAKGVANGSACLQEIRKDLCDAYIYVQDNLQTELEQRGLKCDLKTDRCLVTGGSAGGTSSIFLVRFQTSRMTDLQAADVERLRDARPDLPPFRAVIPAFPLVEWEAEDGNCKPRSALEGAWSERKEWSVIKALFDEPVSCSDPYPSDVL
jgi:hypothetical protein